MSKESILKRVRESLEVNTAIPDHKPHYNGTMKLTHDLLEEFIVNQTNNKGIVVHSNRDNLTHDINKIIAQEEAKQVLYNTDIQANTEEFSGAEFIPYTHSIDTQRAALFKIDTSIVEARCGVANVGVVGLSANSLAPRLSSLITNTCIYLLDKNNIVEHLFSAINFIKKYEEQKRGNKTLPSNIIFVAGPSRTADIELQTVFGVHGPRKTFVVLY